MIMFVMENVYLLVKISKLFVKSINLLCNGEKLATTLSALSFIKKMYHRFNSGIRPCCDTHYLFLRMGSFECYTSKVGNIHA